MKKLFVILNLIICMNCFAQFSLGDNWNLETVSMDGVLYEKPFHYDAISTTFFSSNNRMFASICESGGIISDFMADEVNFRITFTDIAFYQGDCTNDESIELKDAIFLFFENNEGISLTYNVVDETDGSKVFTITNGEDYVSYRDQLGYPPQIISENTWYLQEMIIDGENHPAPNNEEVPFIDAIFHEKNFITGACGDFLGGTTDFNLETEQLLIVDLTYGLMECNDPDNGYYKGMYYNFFESIGHEPFNYTVTENSDGTKTLIIYDQNGNQAIYNAEQMATEEFSNEGISIYPNPTTGKLNLKLNPNETVKSIQIFDQSGKLISNQLDLSQSPKGIYTVKIETSKGIYSEKLIRK